MPAAIGLATVGGGERAAQKSSLCHRSGAARRYRASAAAQEFPSRTMRFYVGFSPGTGSDLVKPAACPEAERAIGPTGDRGAKIGSGGIFASEAVVKSPPDGHTMVLLSGAHPVLAAMRKSLPYDPVRDFGAVSLVSSYPIVISVAADSPVKSLPDLLARAKAAPGRITYSMARPEACCTVGRMDQHRGRHIDGSGAFQGFGARLDGSAGRRIDAMIDTGTATLARCARARSGQLRCPRPPGIRLRPTCRRSPKRSPASRPVHGSASLSLPPRRARSSTA